MFCIIQQNCYITQSLHFISKHISSVAAGFSLLHLFMANLVNHNFRLSY